MIRNVVILLQVVFTERYMTTVGVDALSRDFNVTILDLTPWYNPNIWQQQGHTHHDIVGYHAIHNYKALIAALNEIDEAVVFDYLDAQPNTSKVRAYLAQRNLIRVHFATGHLPSPAALSFSERALALLSSDLPRRILAKLNMMVNKKHLKQQPKFTPNLIIFSGEIGQNEYLEKAPHILWAHSLEYEEYLALNKEHLKKEPYAVYLDQGVLHHPDYAYSNEKVLITEETFFAPLNSFFDKFEHASGMKVVVAAHPRVSYAKLPNLFAGREVHNQKTAELVRDCSIVFAHCSTALAFAALWKKPVVFLTSKELKRSLLGHLIPSFASYFEAPVVNLPYSSSISAADMNIWQTTHHTALENYVRLFIKKPGSPNENLWKIVSSYIRENL